MPRLPALLVPLLLVAAGPPALGAQQTDSARVAKGDSARKAPRRIPVTAELDRSAFRDAGSRRLLTRAREARLAQDSALRSYDARSYMRVSVGLGVRRLGPERLLFRAEHAARVQWQRGSGVWVETTGRRAVVPMGGADIDMSPATPVPYFPGREALWFPSEDLRKVTEEVNDRDLVHPLATGAEAYYHYESGDSASIRLPDGRAINLRELRISARRPDWRTFVGSFWFDADGGSLVRAAYRTAGEIDMWREVKEEAKLDVQELEERLRTDTGALAVETRRRMEEIRKESGGIGMKIAEGMLSPMRAKISAITVEYGLYEGRFWLPKANVFEGEGTALFARIPVRYEENYRYTSVNGDIATPRVPVAGDEGVTADDTLFLAQGNISIGAEGSHEARDTSAAAVRAREDSVIRVSRQRSDSLLRRADSVQAAMTDSTVRRDTLRIRSFRQRAAYARARARAIERRREQCASDSTYFAGVRTVLGAYRMAIRLPCDESKLATSPDLPRDIYGEGEQLFSTADRDQLLEGLDFGLQAAWGPQRPHFHFGLDLTRYNRIEGLSLGMSATSALGLGYTAGALARFGVADRVPNGELTLSRSNGRATVGITAFHRLSVANDDWGTPLSFGASVSNLIVGRDEGFYYRAYGAEISGSRDAPGPMSGAHMRWRVFGERQYDAGTNPNSHVSLARLLSNARFGPNIDAAQLVALGAGADFARSFGANPRHLRFDGRLRAEAAFTDRSDTVGATGYGRLMFDGTLARPLAGMAWSLTGGAGSSIGDLPPQRAFYVGGTPTVRGQFARLAGPGRVGDTFWLGRAEVARGIMALRPALFYDIGWAGARDGLNAMGRPMSGAGLGVSVLDGLFRLDVSRGIFPERRWRTDFTIGARF
jgi:hypothetical protein